MPGQMSLRGVLLAGALALSGCGITYVSPLVNQRGEDDVQVIPITRDSLAVANGSPFLARGLPEVFSQTAGGGTPRGAGALPEPPDLPDQVAGLDQVSGQAPGRLELRLPPPATPEPYRIGVGDVVQLATRSADAADAASGGVSGAVSGEENRQRYTVRDDGAIAVPEVGAVEIGGLAIEEAEQRLFERFISAGLDPSFSLEIAEFNSQSITVGGAVGSATVLPVTLNRPSLDQALTAAGGLQVDTADLASIRIYRGGTLYQIPLEDYQARGELRALPLLPGDAVFVDTSYDLDRALRFYEQQISIANLRRSDRANALNELQTEVNLRRAALNEARDLFATRRELGEETGDYVYLAGEVGEQSRYELPFGRRATLADALFESGGGFQTETGNPSQIYVLRLTDLPEGTGATPGAEPFTAWHLDARNAVNLTLATRFEMRPNDIIFIEEQPITRWNRAFQQFFPTLLSSAANAAN